MYSRFNIFVTFPSQESDDENNEVKNFLEQSEAFKLLKIYQRGHWGEFNKLKKIATFSELDYFFKDKFKLSSPTIYCSQSHLPDHEILSTYRVNNNFRYFMYRLWMEYEEYKLQNNMLRVEDGLRVTR